MLKIGSSPAISGKSEVLTLSVFSLKVAVLKLSGATLSLEKSSLHPHSARWPLASCPHAEALGAQSLSWCMSPTPTWPLRGFVGVV